MDSNRGQSNVSNLYQVKPEENSKLSGYEREQGVDDTVRKRDGRSNGGEGDWLTIDRVALEIAKLEDDQMALQFKLKDAEWTLKNTPKEIAKIESQIRESEEGRA